jgi:hypothetical protein
VGVFVLQHAQRHIMVVVYNFVFACPSQRGHGVVSKCAKRGRIAGYGGKHEDSVRICKPTYYSDSLMVQ